MVRNLDSPAIRKVESLEIIEQGIKEEQTSIIQL